MAKRANYFKIGLFVIIGITLGLMSLVYLGAGTVFQERYSVETYLDESVQGLAVGSPVKHRGVNIGKIDEITFVRNTYHKDEDDPGFAKFGHFVVIRFSTEENFFGHRPISEMRRLIQRNVEQGLRARLAPEGITGLAYLEIDYMDPQRHPAMEIDWVPTALYIPSAASTMSRLSETFDELSDSFKNDLAPAMRNVREAAKDMPETMQNLNRVLARLDRMMTSQQLNLEELSNNLRMTSEEIKELVEKLHAHPAQVLFGGPPQRPKVVEDE
ncbi:MAG: MCE family protein [Candidatus Omnitrophica bacterium]|nr:MCE family protein [Candidatus Omnitrophota bacterium]